MSRAPYFCLILKGNPTIPPFVKYIFYLKMIHFHPFLFLFLDVQCLRVFQSKRWCVLVAYIDLCQLTIYADLTQLLSGLSDSSSLATLLQ